MEFYEQYIHKILYILCLLNSDSSNKLLYHKVQEIRRKQRKLKKKINISTVGPHVEK